MRIWQIRWSALRGRKPGSAASLDVDLEPCHHGLLNILQCTLKNFISMYLEDLSGLRFDVCRVFEEMRLAVPKPSAASWPPTSSGGGCSHKFPTPPQEKS
jgi:hypothetical protein